MPLPVADRILAILEKGLSAWEKYLATRQETYERNMDRNMRRAINYAGSAFRRQMEIGVNIEDTAFLKAKKNFYKYRNKV